MRPAQRRHEDRKLLVRRQVGVGSKVERVSDAGYQIVESIQDIGNTFGQDIGNTLTHIMDILNPSDLVGGGDQRSWATPSARSEDGHWLPPVLSRGVGDLEGLRFQINPSYTQFPEIDG
jgi:hypothetical protein